MENREDIKNSKEENKSLTDEQLTKKFAKSESSAEIKDIANTINKADPDIDRDELDKKANQFQQEKKDDAKEEAENNADFKQP